MENKVVDTSQKEGEERMKEMLRKQFQLLSEQAQNRKCNPHELAEISHAMIEIAWIIMYPALYQEVFLASRRC